MKRPMNRRDFIKYGALAGTAAGLATVGPGAARLWAQDGPTLYVAKGQAADAVNRAVAALGGIGKFVQPGQRVVIKANISFGNPPEMGTTTHPEVVKAVADLCARAGAKKVIVMDHTLVNAEICREKSGIEAAIKDLGKTSLFTPEQQKFFVEVPVPQGKELKKVELAEVVLKSDVIISLPTAKSHSATGVSFGMKGYMGLIWDRQYFHKSVDCNQAIADLATLVKPQLIIMDAMYALTTNGPAGPGKVEKLDTIIAGTDPVAVDSYTVGIAPWYGKSFKGSQVQYIKKAYEQGLGEIDVEKMTIKTV